MSHRLAPFAMPAAPNNDRYAQSHPVDRLPGYRTLRQLRTRGLPRELLAIREGSAGFRRLCSLRFAPVDDHAGDDLAHEAYVLARLHHPTILPAFDLLEVDGWRVLVLAFEGVFTIDRITVALRKHPVRLDTSAALFIAHRIFDALAHAHGKNDLEGAPLVHGDIHPANVVIRRDGHVLVRGFRGSAPLVSAARSSDLLRLTPYAAPELDQGSPASTQSDVYGAAALVWELFVGQAIPSGPDSTVPSLAVARPDLPAALAAVFDVCLSPDPDARRIRSATMAATLRKAIDMHGGRESLERLYVRVMRRLPASVRALCAGTLPPREPRELRRPIQGAVRGGVERARGALLVGHPTHPLHQPLRRTGDADDAVRVAVPAALASNSVTWNGEDAAESFDDESPTLRQFSSLVDAQNDCEEIADDDDTIVRAHSLEGQDEGRWGKIEPDERPSHIDSARGRFATTLPAIAERGGDNAAEPRSFPPVAADQDAEAAHDADHEGHGPRFGVALGITLLLAPLAWLAGQYGVGPLWTSLASSSQLPSSQRLVSANPTPEQPQDVSVRSVAPSIGLAPSSPAANPFPANSPSPAAASSAPASDPALHAPIPFHQAMVVVQAPPEGVVYVNGVAVGRTGERSLTRGCGLRFVRVGTEAKGPTLHGVRWLSKGQTAKLPCGTLVNLRAVPKR